ncbi:helix-turn-helix domain-containing protein [Fodinicola feengrottensis]|uniref:helix-turn-helix domain-containing protein n=1 Tax=Fodinicola feengrottensis TaxID=435914 RepID=UPI0036F36C1B
MDLITTAVAERIDRIDAVSAQTQQRTMFVRVNAFIEEHLAETDLTPGLIAAAHHVSLRYLHRLFEPQHTTVAAWIRHRRLEKCRHDLADPALHTLPVSAIAARWGAAGSSAFQPAFPSYVRIATGRIPAPLPPADGLGGRARIVKRLAPETKTGRVRAAQTVANNERSPRWPRHCSSTSRSRIWTGPRPFSPPSASISSARPRTWHRSSSASAPR